MGFTDWRKTYDKEKQKYFYKPGFFKTDIMAVKIARGRIETKCCDCGRKIMPSEVTIGGSAYQRRCLKCVAPFFEEIRIEQKKFEELMRETEKKLKRNKEKYKNINLLANLK